MRKVWLAVVMAAFFAACDGGPAGPTAEGGEIRFTLVKAEYERESLGKGYFFATGEQPKITYREVKEGRLGAMSDLDAFPQTYAPAFYTQPRRIYYNGYNLGRLELEYNVPVEFELVTLDGKSRYKIRAEWLRWGDVGMIIYCRYTLLRP